MATRKTARTADLEDPVLQFLQTVWQLEHALERASKRMEDALGVSGPQRFAVRIIGVNPGITSGQLAAILHLHPSTVTGIVQRLESRKLVRRTGSPTDRRVTHLHLTPAGTRLNTPALRGTVERAARLTLRRCSDRQCRAATDMLRQFSRALMHSSPSAVTTTGSG
jgi:DNA-binding MarR family transcriptional regulator